MHPSERGGFLRSKTGNQVTLSTVTIDGNNAMNALAERHPQQQTPLLHTQVCVRNDDVTI